MAIHFDQTHPHHDFRLEAWKYNRDHHEGGRQLIKKEEDYLTRFKLETDVSFAARRKRAAGLYDNLLKRALQAYSSQIFRIDPVRELAGPLDDLQEDVDLYGTHANEFMLGVALRSWLQGIHFVLIDAPSRAGEGQESEAAAQARGDRPWLESIDSLKVVDWGVEMQDSKRRGILNYAVIRDQIFKDKTPFTKPRVVTRLRLYTPQEIRIFEIEKNDDGKDEVTGAGEFRNEIGEVPLVPFYDEFVKPMQGQTVMDDVALASNALWQTLSAADEAFYYQSFAILAAFTNLEQSEFKLGEGRGVRLQPGDNLEYVVPGATPFEVARERVRAIVERVADIVFSRTNRQLPSAQVESAEGKEIDRAEFVALLERKAVALEKSERRVWELMGKFQNAGESAVTEIEYNRKFRVDDRTPDEWIQLTEQGIYSLAEWYMLEHPGLEEEDAWERIKENLEKNDEVKPKSRMEDEMRAEIDAALAADGTPAPGQPPPPGQPPQDGQPPAEPPADAAASGG